MLQEELLLQCHEAAVAAAQFTPAEDFDYDSSGSEVGRVPGGDRRVRLTLLSSFLSLFSQDDESKEVVQQPGLFGGKRRRGGQHIVSSTWLVHACIRSADFAGDSISDASGSGQGGDDQSQSQSQSQSRSLGADVGRAGSALAEAPAAEGEDALAHLPFSNLLGGDRASASDAASGFKARINSKPCMHSCVPDAVIL